MASRREAYLWLVVAVVGAVAAVAKEDITIPLNIGDRLRHPLAPDQSYTLLVDTTTYPLTSPSLSSFVVQVHTQLLNVSLTNGSQYCASTSDVGCTTRGSSVGMVQIWDGVPTLFPFHVRMEDGGGKNTTMLLAVIGVQVEDPIPGGCTLTSNLFIDPNIALTYTLYSSTVRFQDSDIGYDPSAEFYPTCDVQTGDSPYPLQLLDYTVYQKCLGNQDFSVSHMLDAIEDMLTVGLSQHQEYSYSKLAYNDIKNIEFASMRGQGVVYNVIATDKNTGSMSAYVPVVTYACDLHSNGTIPCREDIPVVNIVFGLVFALAGLFLCWVGHNFFHAEVFVFHAVAGSFLWYMILSIVTTSWSHSLLVGLSVLFAVLYSLLWFLFWFLTGWYWIQVIVFGAYAGFLLTACLLYTPLEDVSVLTVLQISYVYIMVIVCGMILFMVPLVASPRSLNIWCSSLVGSYSVVFSVGMFTYTELAQIVLLVVRKFSIAGFYQARLNCPLQTKDYILIAIWLLLLISGLTIQTVIVELRKRKFKRHQMALMGPYRVKFISFPQPSLLTQLRRYKRRKCPEEQPLLSPSRLSANRSVNVGTYGLGRGRGEEERGQEEKT